MSAGHHHDLYLARDSVLHRLPAAHKLVAGLSFILIVVATPRAQYWAFGAYVLLILVCARYGEVPWLVLARRLLVEVPFVAFALMLPFLASGERIHVLGLALSREGLLGAWGILAKATLGVATSSLLAATTRPHDLVHGLQSLRMPSVLVSIMAFMLRYADVITAQMGRMRVARESRGFRARGLRAAPALAASAGTLFIRSYERGERVHLAMLSRGYNGSMPLLAEDAARPRDGLTAAALPITAALIALAAWTLQ